MRLVAYVAVAAVAAGPLDAQQQSAVTFHQLGHAVLRELIETNTTASSGNTTPAADQLGVRFRDAGFPDADVQVIGPVPRNRNLIVRYRGSGAHKPILLLAHLDVVEAKKEDWTVDPFRLTEETGATDGLYLRNAGFPVYGFSGLFIPIDDVRAHGRDERILITSFDEGMDFTYDLLKRIAR